MKRIFILIIPVLLFNGCSNKKELVYFPNGELQFEAQKKNGVRDGVSKTYDIDSKVIHKGYWVSDTLNAYLNYFYHFDGSLKQLDSFSVSDDIAYVSEFYEGGALRRKGLMFNKKPFGKHSFYYEDKSIMEVDYYDSLGGLYDYEKYDEEGSLKKNEQAALINIKKDTVSLGEEIEFTVYMVNNRSKIRVILGLDYDEENRILYDTINYFIPPEGRDDGALVKYMPKKKGELILYGLVQDREDKPNGMIEVGTVPFSEKFYVTD